MGYADEVRAEIGEEPRKEFAQMASRRKTHRLLISCLIAILGTFTIGAALVWLRQSSIAIPQRSFSSELWVSEENVGSDYPSKPNNRQMMIKDLLNNVLPGKDRAEIEALLGPSPAHEQMKRYCLGDLERDKTIHNEQGQLVFQPTGEGYYYDEYDWDLIYPIGKERIFIYDHRGLALSPDPEYLIIRLGPDDRFKSWFIDGSTRWPSIVGTRYEKKDPKRENETRMKTKRENDAKTSLSGTTRGRESSRERNPE